MSKCSVSVEDCLRPVYAKSLCKRHYNQQWAGKDFSPLLERMVNKGLICSFETCINEAMVKGLCDGHYQQQWAGKDFSPLLEQMVNKGLICSVNDCIEKATKKGLCRSHYSTEYRKAHKEKLDAADVVYRTEHKEEIKANSIWRKFHLTMTQYKALIANGCAICGSMNDLCVDHDHKCCPGNITCGGKCIRGVLCTGHNKGEGHFKTIEELLAMVAYLLQFEDVIGKVEEI